MACLNLASSELFLNRQGRGGSAAAALTRGWRAGAVPFLRLYTFNARTTGSGQWRLNDVQDGRFERFGQTRPSLPDFFDGLTLGVALFYN